MKEKAKELAKTYDNFHEEAKHSLKGLEKLIEKNSMSLEEVVELIDNKMEADEFHPELKNIESMSSDEFAAMYKKMAEDVKASPEKFEAHLKASGMTADELAPLRYCTDLEALDLGHMNYRNLDFLRDMTKIRYLILVQGKFSDISVLANMPDLEYLELFNNNRIVDLTPLLSCRKLKHLNIGYCYYAGWETLTSMTGLERLWMPHVEISAEELTELEKALPDTLIYAPPADPMGSTGGGWREDQAYYEMRDFFHMDYLPGGTGME